MNPSTIRWLTPAILLTAVFAVYRQVLDHSFTYFDDNAYVFKNQAVLDGFTWNSIKYAFSTGLAGNYHPLTVLSHMLDIEMFGLWAGGHAFTNLLWHSANVLLVWALVRKLTGRDSAGFFVALFFAIHPLNVESVACISQRKTVISACFGLLSLLAYLRFAELGGKWRYILSLGAAAVSLLAKPLFVTLPAVLLLLDYWPLARLPQQHPRALPATPGIGPVRGRPAKWISLIAEKVPFVLLAGASSLATLHFQEAAGAMNPAKANLITSLAGAVSSYFFYLEKIFWPVGLAAFYPLARSYSVTHLLISTGALLVITTASWRLRHSRPYVTFGWLWYLVILSPMAGFIRVGGMGMADRYAYIPLLGIFVVLVLPAIEWGHSFSPPRYLTRLLLLCGLCFLGSLGFVAHKQVGYWKTTARLFARVMVTQGANERLLNMMGYEAFDQGDFARSIPFFQKTLAFLPNNWEATSNLGIALFAVGRFAEADMWLERASKLPRPPSAGVLNARGRIAEQQGRMKDACDFWRAAIAVEPAFGEARRNLAHALLTSASTDEALAIIDEGVEITPWDDRLYEVRAEILESIGRASEANMARGQGVRQKEANLIVPALRNPAPSPVQ